jgi:hypothetical protein
MKVVGLPFRALRVLFSLPTREEVREVIEITSEGAQRIQPPHFLPSGAA